MKWDGDMFLTYRLQEEFKLFISKLMDSDMPVLGITKGLTVFKGFDENYYYRENSYEKEIRIFDNLKNNYFTKDVLWEKLQSDIETQFITYQKTYSSNLKMYQQMNILIGMPVI